MSDEWLMDRIAADPRARRELLWLRAMERGDVEEAEDLERVDPDLPCRLANAGLDVTGNGEPDALDRERFGRLWDARYEHHAARFSDARDAWLAESA